MRHAPWIALVALSCASSADEEETERKIEVSIQSPLPSGDYFSDEAIAFRVKITEQGKEPTDLGNVEWRLDDQRAKGTSGEFKKVEAGNYTVTCEAEVGGETYSDKVNITVDKGDGDADADADTDADADADGDVDSDVTFSGTISAHVWYDGQYGTFDGDCPGSLTVVWSAADRLTGSGQCSLDHQYDLPFTIDGSGGGGSISGDLVMTSDGTDYKTPFTGSGKPNTTLNANYDNTVRDGGDSIRIAGTWTAEPQ